MTTRFKKVLSLGLVSLLVALQMPLVALADDQSTPAPTTTDPTQTQTTTPAANDPTQTTPAPTPDPAPTTPATTTPGPTKPPGPDANLYTFNPTTGLWESSEYTWNPKTGQTAPKSDPGYYYNPATGMWDTTTYQYHPETGTYQPVTVAAAVPPAGSVAPAAAAAADGSIDPSLASTLAALFGPAALTNTNTGPNSTNTIGDSSTSNSFFSQFSKAVVQNNLNSSATTGDASVTGNTNAGDATTGPASVIANLFNLLSSAWSWANGGLGYFVQNLMGNQNGDITLVPTDATGGGGSLGGAATSASNSGTGPNSTNTINDGSDGTTTVNNQSSGTINNNLNLLAQSGDASVAGNTNAGSATSGDATTDLNIMNMINSAIGAGQSFLGVLNIFGNLNGDILFPAGFLDSAVGSGATGSDGSTAANTTTGPNSTNTIGDTSQNTANLTNDSTGTINNNLQTAAQSGTADVTGNTTAGSATTGAANTQTDTFNLLNDNLVGDNAVLVFVNVLGHWIGGIMNLPGGDQTTAGLLTGNASLTNADTGPGSTNTIGDSSQNNLNVTNNTTGTINNNVNAGAISGDASVTNNTNAGNATSGNASVAANVANFMGSTLNLKKWFGVLVINVFGDWTGDVNQNTAAGNPVASATGTSSSLAAPAIAHLAKKTVSGGGQGSGTTNNSSVTNTAVKAQPATGVKVLAAQTAPTFLGGEKSPTAFFFLGAAVLLMLAGVLLGADRKLGAKKS